MITVCGIAVSVVGAPVFGYFKTDNSRAVFFGSWFGGAANDTPMLELCSLSFALLATC